MSQQQKENMQSHPSYAVIGVYRAHGSMAAPLFGSSIKHRDTICLEIKHASVLRSLNQDWIHGENQIVEIEMSYSQFAQMITSMNVGDGVPCTLRRLNGERIADCPFEDKAEQHRREFKKDIEDTYAETENLINHVKSLFSEKKSFTKGDREDICAH